MAEHFTGYGMPSVDFGALGNIGDTYTRARQGAVRERVLSEIGQGKLDPAAASQKLIAAGLPDEGISLARLAESRGDRSESRALRQQQFEFQKQEAERNQRNADRQFELTKSQAVEKPQIVWQEDENGQKVPFLQDPRNPEAIRRLQPGGSPAPEAANPYAPTGKLTEQQSKDRLFVGRMVGSHGIINSLEGINNGAGGFMGGMAENATLPGSKTPVRDTTAFNASASTDRQKFVQAQRDFLNAVLRKESGAAIAPSEFENGRRQYFPMPGDSPEVIAQKRTNRMTEIEGMMAGAGKGYKPPEGYVGTKDKPQQAGAPLAPPKPGTVQDGYRYIGGDPASQNSWKRI